jgi:hypothetical protein
VTGLQGADPFALDNAARRFRERAELLARIAPDVVSLLEVTRWEGSDAHVFRTDVNSTVAPTLRAVADVLVGLAETLTRDADDQRQASTARDGTGGVALAPRTSFLPARSPQDITDGWLQQAAANAGIDLGEWNPSEGAFANEQTIEDVYRYYGDLFLQHPHLQWAAMANLIGPSFAAGFFDLDTIRDGAGTMADTLDRLPQLPPGLEETRDLLRDLSEASEGELAYFETTFLEMQRQIFFDQARMHEAYLSGGLEAINELAAASQDVPGMVPIDDRTVQAWELIDEGIRSGNQDLVAEGNYLLLEREQRVIIDDFYNDMRNHNPPIGPAMTYMMTLVGDPSVPGAQSFPEVFPLDVTLTVDNAADDIPFIGGGIDVVTPDSASATITTPLPDGNIASFDDRWALIEQDTLPAFQELLSNDPELARELAKMSVEDRIEAVRLDDRIDDIAVHLLTSWDVSMDVDW